jgi:signal peptide peptidase SppA
MEWNFKNLKFRPWAVGGVVFLFLAVAIPVVAIYFVYNVYTEDIVGGEDTAESEPTPSCNVVGLALHGLLDTYVPPEGSEDAGDVTGSEDLVYNIEKAAKDKEVKAVLLEVDSSGGYPVAADEIAKSLKIIDKPTVAIIRGWGDSAAYWAATGADVIFAHPLSDVGSIGVTSSYLDNVGYNTKEGYKFEQLSLGKFKDLGDPNKTLTSEERAIIMRQNEQGYEYFIKTVAANRNIPIEEVRKLATGESWTGTEALELKLIDKLGGMPEVEAWLKEKIGTQPEICW